MDGLLLIRKPAGVTSFQALGPVKKFFGIKKAGHAGTLDRFAEGLLLVLTGRMTKFVPYFMDLEKEYEALIEFGKETDTLDPEGAVIRTGTVPDEGRVREAMHRFSGTIMQRPPEYSAVHSGGERAYRLARRGDTVELEEREVRVYQFGLIEYTAPFLRARIRCSKGTYVRSLARDLGTACDSCAYVKELVRSAIGPFKAEQAVSPDRVSLEAVMSPLDLISSLDALSLVRAPEESEQSVINGMPLRSSMLTGQTDADGEYAVFSSDDRFLAVIEKKDGKWLYKFTAGCGRR